MKEKLLSSPVASRGIGKGIALKFASEGADIAFTDLFDDENMAATVKEIEALGVKAKGYASNAADFAQTEEVVAKVKEDFGHINVLVNNAGSNQGRTHAQDERGSVGCCHCRQP